MCAFFPETQPGSKDCCEIYLWFKNSLKPVTNNNYSELPVLHSDDQKPTKKEKNRRLFSSFFVLQRLHAQNAGQ